ncbi:MAG TPA: hypothetical protein VIR57_03790 [Chloroflexota bacterium]|jgi:hypothetical protein
MSALTSKALKDQADMLYERYGKPLETAYRGQYVAIAPDGRTVVAQTHTDAADRAVSTFGRGSFIFKIGEKAVGRWR